MAKKKTTDSSPATTRRRTTRRPAAVPPGDGRQVPKSVGAPQESISKAADAAPRGPATMSDTPAEASTPSYDDIAREAYLRYLKRGGDHGRDFDDWLEAEQHLRSRR